jgi:hypothetical protein
MEQPAPIVVELFTSQGCPSCPPADAILETLSRDPDIIALGCHVTYWDRLNRKDSLSQDFCDIRQHGYVSLYGQARVYTPHMVINGGAGFVGSDKINVKKALEDAKNKPIGVILVRIKNRTDIHFSLPTIKSGSYRLWAYGYKKSDSESIDSGENKGRKTIYANPVLTYTNLGSWHGEELTQSFPIPEGHIDGMAILAQDKGYGEIIAAGKIVF